MRPRVIVHNAVSADGRSDGFEPDVGLFYRLAAATWSEDITLTGSETVLAAGLPEDEPGSPDPEPRSPDMPLLVVADGRGRVKSWNALRRSGYWRDAVALVRKTTPASYRRRLDELRVDTLVLGGEAIDLAAALDVFGERFHARSVRVDSGGRLSGALLHRRLVDEVSLLVHPYLVTGMPPVHLFPPEKGDEPKEETVLRLLGCERVAEDLVHLRYEVVR
jgi:2,5-diamino-6-(ribosylamino)-4(3H)-pyrimidinone 5'-phosphate reductase